MTHNFDFGAALNEHPDSEQSRAILENDSTRSVYGFLVSRLGMAQAQEVYDGLERISKLAVEQHGGYPGIAFDVDGGRFVAFNPPQR